MLTGDRSQRYLWPEVARRAVILINYSSTKANMSQTPNERFFTLKPNVSELKVFGCLAYLHLRKPRNGHIFTYRSSRNYLLVRTQSQPNGSIKQNIKQMEVYAQAQGKTPGKRGLNKERVSTLKIPLL